MAVPKRKVSKARRDKRRSSVWKLDAPALVECPQCHEKKAPHRICPSCGYYNGEEILRDGKIVAKIKDEKKKSADKSKKAASSKAKAPAKTEKRARRLQKRKRPKALRNNYLDREGLPFSFFFSNEKEIKPWPLKFQVLIKALLLSLQA